MAGELWPHEELELLPQQESFRPYVVQDKDTAAFDDQLCTEIYGFHLSVRQWQIDNQNNIFSNFYESREDLPRINAYYIESGGNFFVAQDSATQEVIGIVGLRNDGDGHGELKRLAVNPERHRQRIATRLVASLIEWAKDNGFSSINLRTGERENAKPVYERAGFKLVSRLDRNGDYVMELDLDDSDNDALEER
jgi:GNAT superfamily N-acetyltransferase